MGVVIPTSWRLAFLLPTVVAVGALEAGSARAETDLARDTTHDMVQITRQHPAQSAPDPEAAFGDLTALRVRYGTSRVHAVLHVRRLDHSRRFGTTFEVKYGGPAGFHYAQVSIGVRRDHWQGHLTWAGDDLRPCDVAHAIDYRHDRISMSFPASCIDAPPWVKSRILFVSRARVGVFDIDDLPEQPRTVGSYGVRVHRG